MRPATQNAMMDAVRGVVTLRTPGKRPTQKEWDEKWENALDDLFGVWDRHFTELAKDAQSTDDKYAGSDYDPATDDLYWGQQTRDVWEHMSDGQWHTVEEIAEQTGHKAQCVTAQLGHLRKSKHGSWRTEKRKVQGARHMEFRLLNPDGSPGPPYWNHGFQIQPQTESSSDS